MPDMASQRGSGSETCSKLLTQLPKSDCLPLSSTFFTCSAKFLSPQVHWSCPQICMLVARKSSLLLVFCLYTAAELTQFYLPTAIVPLLHICNKLVGDC